MPNVLAVPTVLKDASGNEIIVDQGESSDLTATLFDAANTELTTSAILSLTATLTNASTSAAINSRNAQDILGTNGGSLADNDDGEVVVTLRLQPADNPIVAETDPDKPEEHYLLLTWTWNDGTAVRTGKHQWSFGVRLRPSVT